MPTLSKEYRKQLEKVVLVAREEAESGAAAALESFGVGEARKPAHLDKAGEDLRKKLRAHGRQLGDVRRPDDSQEVGHLVHETAYEHWHRMLFARFLAENGFLIEPESGLDVDLEFSEERARELKTDKWEVASGFAQRMLAAIFRPDDPVLQLRLPAETRNRLTALLASLPAEVFTAGDSLGWVYQFWQTKKKDEVNGSGEKIGADELSAVTQLFTEDYMVDFLLDNTLGAWHAGKVLAANPKLRETALSEDELRRAVSLPGCPWSYLRFIAGQDGKWGPAAGTFDGWPKTAKELKCLDPCMGSGHFIVALFERLVALRLDEEALEHKDAVTAVIRDNVFGLELDPRCTQIGAFNLALAAWRRLGHCALPGMNLACSGLAPNTMEVDWLAIAGDDQRLRAGMERLYRLFSKAAVLGSLINPRALGGDLLVAEFNQLQPLLAKALERETGDEVHELAVTAQGVAKAAEILAGQFTLVATNVPYRGANDLTPELNALIEVAHPRGRGDLATCFLERCIEFCASGGTPALVTPQAWLFIGPYRRLREHLLATVSLTFIAQLGKRAFETITGEVVNVNLATLTRRKPTEGTQFCSLDVTPLPSPSAKALALTSEGVELIPQLRQLSNPDARIVAEATRSTTLLREYADSYKGVATGDIERFIHYFWEHSPLAPAWFPFQGRVDMPSSYGGREQVLLWENGSGQLYRYVADRLGEDSVGAWIRGAEAWGRSGIAIGQMTSLPSTLYSGDLFDENTAAVVPKNEDDLPAIWAFCQSQKYRDEVKKLDNSSLKIPNLTLIKVPFDIAEWRTVAAEKYPNGLPEPFSGDPTQWLFSGHPKSCEHPLQVAVARLVGYRWPRQSGSLFQKCPELHPDGLEKHADKDGVVCFSQVRDEAPAADRLRALLAEAYGAEWSHAKERQLIAASGSKADSLEDWLLNDFFRQHCEIFQKRPFVWHIWDGLKDGFNVLVNYHALAGADGLGARTLETLAYAYLERDWIERQRDAVKQKAPGAEGRLAAAQELKQQLERILGGEPPHDIFVRWKPLHQQALGWQPDMNDGVRLNIRPFILASVGGGKKGCGLFRSHPGSSIKWGKDKGKEPARPRDEFPWFWSREEQGVDFTGNAEFDGNRWNDCHYTTAMKQEARTAQGLK